MIGRGLTLASVEPEVGVDDVEIQDCQTSTELIEEEAELVITLPSQQQQVSGGPAVEQSQTPKRKGVRKIRALRSPDDAPNGAPIL